METSAIAKLLQPFVKLDEMRLHAILRYIDLLLKWNVRVNLTAVRVPEEIVQRHFGESFYAANYVLSKKRVESMIDLGSGAGFPGVPFAMLSPDLQVTLIESNQKKATFLKELVLALGLTNAKVFSGRAESYVQSAERVTMRAVEKFDKVLLLAQTLAQSGGQIVLMISSSQVETAKGVATETEWSEPVAVPGSHSRVLLIGTKSVKVE